MTYNYRKYEFTAFTEADFLGQGGNGSSIGCGDTFTMPGAATVTMSTWDNDSTLSGDNYSNENANDSSGQKASVDGARVGSQMYAESYHVLHGSDGKTYYMIEIEVEGYDAPGAGDDFFTFYGAVPPAGVELTVAQTCNVKGSWVDFKCLGAGEKAPANEAPTFTDVPADGIICVDENQTFVIDLGASDADGDTLTFEIVGGADASAFTIDAETGELTFTAGPDYEAPTDGNGNNVYDVTVKVSDGKGGEDIKPLWIKVKDVDEATSNGTCIVVEAEDMQLCGYRVENNANASDGQVIKGSACGWASAKTTFDGPEGQYDLKLSVIDENDGNGRICVSVNGQWVLDVRLDQNDGGDGLSNSSFRELMINDIDLKPGDVVKIWGLGNNGEYARIDKLEFCGEKIDPMTAELGDTVWFDTDKDGIQDGDEIGAAGVTVLLKDAAGNTIDQTTTDADGNYLFSGLAAGDYKVCVVAPGAYAFTDQNAGDDAADSDVMANGMSDMVTLAEGESNLTVDAGLVDPGTASLEGRVFCDENDNDIRDAGDGPVDNVKVTLLTAAGVVVATTTTAADGSYSFTGLDAGDYKVMFDGNTVDGKLFVGTDAGSNDTVDSDADANGMTGVYTLNIGDKVTDVDAGVEVPNADPEAKADEAKVCADDTATINVLGNDMDMDADVLSVLSISDADEMAFVGDSLTLDSGATVTLNADGTVSYDTNGAHSDLLVGSDAAEETITYTVSDGNGGTGSSTLDITVCGATSTLQMICDSLPAQLDLNIGFDGVNYQIVVADDASTTADDGLASQVWTGACIDIVGELILDTDLTVNVYGTCGPIPDGLIENPENLDQINWIINQDFVGQNNMEGSAQYTIFDVQEAVWALSDGTITNNANANEIVAKAAEGEGFISGEGDLVAVIFDPIAPNADVTDTQTFIMGVAWDALELDCIC